MITVDLQLQRQRGDGSRGGTARRARRITPTTLPGRLSCRRFTNCLVRVWPNRDPLEELGFASLRNEESSIGDSMNLYGFVDNNPVDGVDALGLFLAAIDGTDSRKWLHINPTTGRYNSHVRNFFEDYAGPGGKQYWNGPNLFGGGVSSTVDEIYKKICDVLKADPNEQINIVGHSRGGLIAILVAKKLKDKPCTCGSKGKIHFMGLYDAVDRYLWANAASIPDNVEQVAHARRDPGVHSGPFFGNCGTSGGQSYAQQFWFLDVCNG
jgi:hypothetical protein